MEVASIYLDGEGFDKAIHGGLDEHDILPECGDLAFYIKPGATENGKAGVAITFTAVHKGETVRCQAVTTAALLDALGHAIMGYRDGGHIRY